ncbi:MAG: glucosylglycerol hydrolase, partial [Cyanobacteria bacterium P01_H01_bin.121]
GETLPDVLDNAYDNPAVTLWVYGFSPGLPMDFLNALMQAPWFFFRNTDDRYGVKVVAEETTFLDWQISDEIYDQPGTFPRLKELGFERLDMLHEFSHALNEAMITRDYTLEAVVLDCQFCLGDDTSTCSIDRLKKLNRPDMINFLKNLDTEALKDFARCFMEDGYEVCRVARYADTVSPAQSDFNLGLRQFRQAHPWLGENLGGSDRFNKISSDEHTVFYGIRSNPTDSRDQVVLLSHMGGEPVIVTLADTLQLDLETWEVAIASPGLEITDLNQIELHDMQGLLLTPKGSA